MDHRPEDDTSPTPAPTLTLPEENLKLASSCKIVDSKAHPAVTIHIDTDGHLYLMCENDSLVPRGTRLASVGAGATSMEDAAQGRSAVKSLVNLPCCRPHHGDGEGRGEAQF